jgi:hypothetical protein
LGTSTALTLKNDLADTITWFPATQTGKEEGEGREEGGRKKEEGRRRRGGRGERREREERRDGRREEGASPGILQSNQRES